MAHKRAARDDVRRLKTWFDLTYTPAFDERERVATEAALKECEGRFRGLGAGGLGDKRPRRRRLGQVQDAAYGLLGD
jgi:hypothetical protein